jgi:PPP family 3-phenylpropionic acid transporter
MVGVGPGSEQGAGPIRALFFAYFAFVGIYSPYLSLWFDSRGLSIAQIAVLMSLPQLLRIVAPPFWGWLSDRGSHRAAFLRLSSGGALLIVLLFPLAQGPVALAVLLVMLCFMTAAQMPIGEALALERTRGDAGQYGRIRLWGSIGFVCTVLAGGPLLDHFGMMSLPWLMAAALALLVAVSVALPEQTSARATRAVESAGSSLRDPATIAFFVSAFLMVFAHAALYSFFSLYLERLGYSRAAIGAIWGLGVLAEIALFSVQRSLFSRFSPMALLAFSFAVCALRFALVGASDGALWVLLPCQLMHAVTFGLHHSASMAVLHRWFGSARQGSAQATFTVVAYGLGGSSGGWFAGWLWQGFSPQAMFYGAALAAVLGYVAVRVTARLDLRRRHDLPVAA